VFVGFEFSEVFERTNPGGFKIPEPEKIHTQIPFWLPKEEWYRDVTSGHIQEHDEGMSYWMALLELSLLINGPSVINEMSTGGIQCRMEEQAKEIGEGFKDISRFTEEMPNVVRKEDRPRPAKESFSGGQKSLTLIKREDTLGWY